MNLITVNIQILLWLSMRTSKSETATFLNFAVKLTVAFVMRVCVFKSMITNMNSNWHRNISCKCNYLHEWQCERVDLRVKIQIEIIIGDEWISEYTFDDRISLCANLNLNVFD